MPRADLERTLNMGVGFVAVLPAGGVDAAAARWRAASTPGRWVTSPPPTDAPVEDGVEVVRGAKGVDGGAVQVVGDYARA